MKNISFLSENLQFLEVKLSIYLNRRVFVMHCGQYNRVWRKGDNICDFLFAFLDTKGSTLKGKNLLRLGANSFLFRVDPFSEGRQNNFDRVVSPESVSIYLKYGG